MTPGPVDLHLHSDCSDGSDPPAKVAERAAGAGLSAMALTDHDTLAGVKEAAAAAAEFGVDFLPGVEISCGHLGREIHVLCYGVGRGSPPLEGLLARIRDGRRARGSEMIAKLRGLGINLGPGDVGAGESPGRMHVARALRDYGVTKTTQEGFDRFLNPGRPAFVPKTLAPLPEALEVARGVGGVAVLAHPGLGKGLRNMMAQLLALPFDGIEAYHVSHTPGQVEAFLALAAEHGIVATGGSDCHGTIKGRPEMGRVLAPRACYEALRARIADRQA